MKRLFVIAWVLVLLCAAPAVFAKPELEGGDVLAHAPCAFYGFKGYCFLVSKGDVMYVALHDKEGEHSIFQLHTMPEDGHILDKHLLLLWSRRNA